MGGVISLPAGLNNIISLIGTGNYSTPPTVGQAPIRTQEITPRTAHEPWTQNFLKTIGTGVCDFGPSVRDFLIHYGSDSHYDLPKLGDGLD